MDAPTKTHALSDRFLFHDDDPIISSDDPPKYPAKLLEKFTKEEIAEYFSSYGRGNPPNGPLEALSCRDGLPLATYLYYYIAECKGKRCSKAFLERYTREAAACCYPTATENELKVFSLSEQHFPEHYVLLEELLDNQSLHVMTRLRSLSPESKVILSELWHTPPKDKLTLLFKRTGSDHPHSSPMVLAHDILSVIGVLTVDVAEAFAAVLTLWKIRVHSLGEPTPKVSVAYNCVKLNPLMFAPTFLSPFRTWSADAGASLALILLPYSGEVQDAPTADVILTNKLPNLLVVDQNAAVTRQMARGAHLVVLNESFGTTSFKIKYHYAIHRIAGRFTGSYFTTVDREPNQIVAFPLRPVPPTESKRISKHPAFITLGDVSIGVPIPPGDWRLSFFFNGEPVRKVTASGSSYTTWEHTIGFNYAMNLPRGLWIGLMFTSSGEKSFRPITFISEASMIRTDSTIVVQGEELLFNSRSFPSNYEESLPRALLAFREAATFFVYAPTRRDERIQYSDKPILVKDRKKSFFVTPYSIGGVRREMEDLWETTRNFLAQARKKS